MENREIPKGWRETTLDNIARIHNATRIPLSSAQRVLRQGKYPYYGASGIIDNIDDYLFEGEFVLISEDGENLNTRKTPIAFKAKGKFWVNNHAHIVQGLTPFLNDYIVYYLQKTNLSPFITGAAQPKLSKENLLKIPFIIPENFDEIEAISNVLSSLDEKIELLEEENKTLETLAQTIFTEWFVNFNFPGATGEMEDSELGDIPKGWRVGKLGEVTNIKGGSTPSTKDETFWNGNISWTSPKDLSNSKSLYLLNTEKKITLEGLKKVSSGLLPRGTLLLSSRAPIGYLALSNIDVAINQGYIAFIEDSYFSNIYTYLWLKLNMQLVINTANGSTFLEISKSSFRGIKCLIATKNLLNEFQITISPIFVKILNNTEQIQTLKSTRDTLLPRLTTGEIRVEGFGE